jgi:hydroxymethylpyrimidine pyrophosphatase-like HAD family hydrolase
LYQVNLSCKEVVATLEFLKNSELDFMLHHAVPDNHRFAYRRASRDNADFETRLARYAEFGQPLDSIALSEFGEAAQFLAVVTRHRTADALQAVRSGLPGLSIVHSTSPLDHASTWIEFFHPAVSKGQTAAWLAAELGVKPWDTMAIGNDYNDLDLLEWAAHSYVVDNAPADLKCRFQPVASNNNGGVAQAVGRWLNGQA